MDRDTFIITVYCLVVEHYQLIKEKYPIRRGGFLPALSDEEVITMEICGAYFKLQTDKDLIAYFHSHYRHFFPHLRERSLFVRQAAHLWQVKTAIWELIIRRSGQSQHPVQVIDTLPLPDLHALSRAIDASRLSPITGIVRPRRWITTASNSA